MTGDAFSEIFSALAPKPNERPRYMDIATRYLEGTLFWFDKMYKINPEYDQIFFSGYDGGYKEWKNWHKSLIDEFLQNPYKKVDGEFGYEIISYRLRWFVEFMVKVRFLQRNNLPPDLLATIRQVAAELLELSKIISNPIFIRQIPLDNQDIQALDRSIS